MDALILGNHLINRHHPHFPVNLRTRI
jgi:hypothetical protein